MSKHTGPAHTRVKRPLALLMVISALLAALGLSLGSAAQADTSGSLADPIVKAALAPADASTTGVAPPATFTGAAQGTGVNIHADSNGNTGHFFSTTARMCKTGLNITGQTAMLPSSGNCVPKPFVGSSYGDPARTDDGAITVSAAPGNEQVNFTFRVGTGTQNFTADSGPTSITCDADNPCAIWLQIGVDSATYGSSTLFKHYDIQYARVAPGTPGLTVTNGNTTLKADLAPPAQPGNPVFNSYTVSLTGGDCSTLGAPCNAVTVPSSTPTHTFTGLSNFQTYTVNAVANNGSGANQLSSATPAQAPGTPRPVAPAAPSGTAGDSKVVLTWTAVSPAPDHYEMLASPGPTCPAGSPPSCATTNPRNAGSGTSFTFTDLTNGTPYTFQVRGIYLCNIPNPGNFCPGDYSAASAPVAPGFLVQQQITTQRPAGALVLTQVCGVHSADPGAPSAYPAVGPGTHPAGGAPLYNGTNNPFSSATTDPNYTNPGYPYAGSYPTGCGIDMTNAKLITTGSNSGKFFEAIAPLNEVTVADTRDTDPGFVVNGAMSDFTNTVTSARGFSGSQLGWIPQVYAQSAGFIDSDGNGYAQNAVAGPTADPNTRHGSPATGKGDLGSGTKLAQAVTNPSAPLANCPAGALNCKQGGLGVAIFDAKLTLWIPITVPTGTYQGILSITAA